MPTPPTPLTISDDLRKRYPDLIDLILGSESMNDEERQYWINILPIMTPEQVQNLRDILENEKKQLAEIDRKYAKPLQAVGALNIAETESSRKERRSKLQTQEKDFEVKEGEQTDELLKKIEDL